MSLRTLVVVVALALAPRLASAAQVAFDLPNSIECRDVTPETFAMAHPPLKVIEAKFRISARMVDGNPGDIVDFFYVLTSDDKTLRFQDYLPNTTLESAVDEDRVEITDSSENATSLGLDAHVAYKILALGGTHTQSAKKSECSHYKQIAPKEMVLASGTMNREHGVFFRLRPSRVASLEGAKEFTFLATVPKSWRGDLCTIACTARAKKSSFLSTSVVPSGVEHLQIGMYLTGDNEAATLAEELRKAQDALATALAAHPTKENVFDSISNQTVGLFTGKKTEAQWRKEKQDAAKAVVEVENRLAKLAR